MAVSHTTIDIIHVIWFGALLSCLLVAGANSSANDTATPTTTPTNRQSNVSSRALLNDVIIGVKVLQRHSVSMTQMKIKTLYSSISTLGGFVIFFFFYKTKVS